MNLTSDGGVLMPPEAELEVLEHLPILLSAYARQGQPIFANALARKYYGRLATETDWTARFAHAAAAGRAIVDLENSGRFALDTRVQTESGTRWHRLQGYYQPWHGAGERAAAFWLLEQDITDLKKAQAELQESQDRLQEIFPGFVSWVSKDCQYLGVNQHLAALYELKPADFVGREVGFNSRNPRFRQMLEAFFDSAERRLQQEISVSVGEEEQPYLLLAQKSRNADRAAIVGIDISAQKAARAELQVTVSRFEGLLDNLRLGVSIVDEDGRILSINQAFCDLFARGDTPHRWSGRDFMAFAKDRYDCFADPEAFLDRHQKLSSSQQKEGVYNEELQLEDGRTWVQDCVPIWTGDRYRGYLWMFRDISDRVRAQQQLLHNAYHDALTGLPNRAFFLEKLQAVLEAARADPSYRFAVLFIDLDRFKVVNDSLGHWVGDKLLVDVARRLRACLHDGDILARLGGDEFAILLPDVNCESDAARVAELIIARVREPSVARGREFTIGSSIGITTGTGQYDTTEEILRDADLAMYQAKKQGGAGFAWLDPQLQARALRRFELETDLRQAIGTEELLLHYQPIVDLDTHTITGFEALVRWQHPTAGMISPAEFIPIAEETGDIVPLGEQVLWLACQQLRAWQAEFPQLPSLAVNLNVSAVQLRQPGLARYFEQTLKETAVDPKHLKLEITESTLVGRGTQELAVLSDLRALGLMLCIDDFGTGYSSLSRLHEFPVDIIKIDRSFVCRLCEGAARGAGHALVQTIVSLAAGLGAGTVAEGIETSTQYQQLRQLGCIRGQGYAFAPPLDPTSATNYLHQGLASLSCQGSRSLQAEEIHP